MDTAEGRRWRADVVPECVDLSDLVSRTMWVYPQRWYDIYGLTWNKAQFKEVGLDPERPPATWDELRDYGKKLAKRDAQGNLVRVGLAIRHVGNPQGTVHKFTWALWGAGADIIDNPNLLHGGKPAFNNAGGLAALKLYLDMLNVDKTTSLSFPDPRAALLQGIASMQISETVSIRARQPRRPRTCRGAPGWGMAPPPVRKTGDRPGVLLGGWLFAVPN